MKIDILHMPDLEMEFMRFLWHRNSPVSAAEIGLGLPHRNWSPSVIHTLAMRLFDKGLLKFYRANGRNYYLPYIEEADYVFVVSKVFVNEMHHGSLTEMVRVLLHDEELLRDEFKSLCELIDAWRGAQEDMAGTELPPVEGDASGVDEEKSAQVNGDEEGREGSTYNICESDEYAEESNCYDFGRLMFWYGKAESWNMRRGLWNRRRSERNGIFFSSA